uniref:non-specific protein-tyrosine kinase n=1 Tax=Candidatus Desulfatibia profunda TaxID=2841695 RepID=A0A8J6TN94_9BACT|nr:polysaccharide biosynthesis tyrosine autokinase [Candidatus Desulfatibia profunda]
MSLQPDEIHLLDYWRVLSKRRYIAVTFFFAVVGLVAIYSFSATPVYKGTAQLLFEIERNQSLNFMEGGTAVIQMKDPAEYFNTQKGIIASRSFADRVVRKLQLPQNPYFVELREKKINNLLATIAKKLKSIFPEKANPADPFQQSPFQPEEDPDLTDIILDNSDLETGRMNNLMQINYYADNPAVAAYLANGIAAAFIEHNLDIRVKPYRDAVEWLSARLVESKEKVSGMEQMLQQYREGKGVVSFEAKENIITQQLQELISQLVQTEAKRQEMEIKYKQIESVIDSPERLATVPDVMNNLVIQGLRNEELTVKRQLSELLEKYGPKHPQVIKANTQLDSIQKNIVAEARKMLSAAKTDYEIARSRETSLRKTIEAQKQEVMNLSRKAIDFNVIAGESESNRQFYELLLKKFQEASLSSGINISNVQIVDRAVIPKFPVKPRRALNILLALIVGLFGGIFAAFFTDYMDNTIKTAEDVDKNLGLALLGIVPLAKGAEQKDPVFMISDPESATAESYRTIRTGLMLSLPEKELKVMLLTSAIPDEGKTTTAVNLAVAMAQMGERVLVVDADLRRHNLHDLFAIKNEPGLSDVIVKSADLSGAKQSLDKYSNLDIITAGTKTPSPSELLGSGQMKAFVAQMRAQYDRIIIDSPPLLVFSDPLALASLVDGIVMVVWGGKSTSDVVRKAILLLSGINAKILGVVLNKIDTTKRTYYYYPYHYPYYSYYYGDKKGQKQKR